MGGRTRRQLLLLRLVLRDSHATGLHGRGVAGLEAALGLRCLGHDGGRSAKHGQRQNVAKVSPQQRYAVIAG